MEVICYTLWGGSHSFSFPDDTPIGKVMFDIGKSNRVASLELLIFLYKCKELETFGLSNPIKTLAENGIVKIHCPFRMRAASYSLGTLRMDYWSFIISVLEKGIFSIALDTQIKSYNRYVHELEDIYDKGKRKESTNIEDPITLEDATNGIFWIENGKKFSMNYSSLIEHVKKFKYVDKDGITQIPNPFTRQPIPDPWRSDFLTGLC